MSDSETLRDDSGREERPAADAKRYAHGSEVVAELRARAAKHRQEVSDSYEVVHLVTGEIKFVPTCDDRGVSETLDVFEQWLDELSGAT